MRRDCGWHCAGIAVGIALASAAAAATKPTATPPIDPDLEIGPCVVATIAVDGLVVVKHGYCRWEDGRWWPLDLPPEIVIGISPKEE